MRVRVALAVVAVVALAAYVYVASRPVASPPSSSGGGEPCPDQVAALLAAVQRTAKSLAAYAGTLTSAAAGAASAARESTEAGIGEGVDTTVPKQMYGSLAPSLAAAQKAAATYQQQAAAYAQTVSAWTPATSPATIMAAVSTAGALRPGALGPAPAFDAAGAGLAAFYRAWMAAFAAASTGDACGPHGGRHVYHTCPENQTCVVPSGAKYGRCAAVPGGGTTIGIALDTIGKAGPLLAANGANDATPLAVAALTAYNAYSALFSYLSNPDGSGGPPA